MPPSTDPIYRLTSPWGKAPRDNEGSRVQCNIPRDVYVKFFLGVLAGCHNTQLSLISTFLHKLTNEPSIAGLPPHYDPDHEERVARVVARLNFEDLQSIRREAFNLGRNDGYREGLTDGRSTPQDAVPRGASGEPAGSDTRPALGRGTTGVRKGNKKSGIKSPDLRGGTAGRVGGAGEETTQG